MKIQLEKESLDDLYRCIEKNISFISTAINEYLEVKELVGVIEYRFDEIRYYLNKVYNLELIDLKKQSRAFYQKWLILKDKDKDTANAAYLEYIKIKCKIDSIENPF